MIPLRLKNQGLGCFALLLVFPLQVLAQQEAYESPAGTKFLLYTPPGYHSTTSSYPLLLSLHSKGEVGDDLTELTSKNSEQMPSRLIYLNRWPQDLPFIVLTPQLKPTEGDPDPVWGPQWPAEYIDEVLRYVADSFRVDPQRIYVTGISKGGIGAWRYASSYPEKVAAIIPISGRSDSTMACRIKDIPIWAFHGDGDELVTPEYSVQMVNAVRACQPPAIFNPRLNILHARNHNGWNEVYNGTSGYKIYEWLLTFEKSDSSNKTPFVNTGPDRRIKYRTAPLHIIGDFFDSDGEIADVRWTQTAGSTLTLDDTGSGLLAITELKTGLFEFQLTVTDNLGAASSDKVVIEIVDSAVAPVITDLVLINGKTGVEIGKLSEGHIIDKTVLGITDFNIQAIASDGTASVKFAVNTDQNTRTQNAGPYFIKQQTSYPEWEMNSGVYLICATPYAKTYANGTPGVSQCYKVRVIDGAIPEACAGTGKIKQEVWTGITGVNIASIPVQSAPSFVSDLSIFETSKNSGDNYGSRLRGYLCVPGTGDYTFWISSDDHAELWLSKDEDPMNKVMIAHVAGWTYSRQWDKYTSQRSIPVTLVQGKSYYVEALLKEGTGNDHLAVGWQLPDGTLERPISGNRLIPYQSPINSVPVVSFTSPEPRQTFTAPASIFIAANASDPDGIITKVEFYNGVTKLGEDAASPYAFAWDNVSAGNYTLSAVSTDNSGESAKDTVEITVNEGAKCAGAGRIQNEVWTGTSGYKVSSIPVGTPPTYVEDLFIFETPGRMGDNYGSRVKGYVCVPQTGDYTFWISSDDHGELWLSTDANPSNKLKIAYVSGWTYPRQWEKYASQKSSPIRLAADRQYYIEALLKEATGGDHMAVGWQLPDGSFERPIPASRLMPVPSESARAFTNGGDIMTFPASLVTSTEIAEMQIYIYPNPISGSAREFTVSGLDRFIDGHQGSMEIQSTTGEVIHAEKLPGQSSSGDYSIRLSDDLPAGVYLLRLFAGDRNFKKRFVIK